MQLQKAKGQNKNWFVLTNDRKSQTSQKINLQETSLNKEVRPNLTKAKSVEVTEPLQQEPKRNNHH